VHNEIPDPSVVISQDGEPACHRFEDPDAEGLFGRGEVDHRPLDDPLHLIVGHEANRLDVVVVAIGREGGNEPVLRKRSRQGPDRLRIAYVARAILVPQDVALASRVGLSPLLEV
jgi:hypothetical protein